MNKRLRGFSLVGGLVLLAAIFTLSGCSSQSPVESSLPQSPDLGRLESGDLSLGDECIALDEKVISAEDGGIIEIEHSGYSHEFVVEAGAIDDDTKITIKTFNEKIRSQDVIVFVFGPKGLVFKEAATLKFQMAELNASALSANLYFFNARLNKWIYQASSRVSDGFAEFDIYHFSKYAISD